LKYKGRRKRGGDPYLFLNRREEDTRSDPCSTTMPWLTCLLVSGSDPCLFCLTLTCANRMDVVIWPSCLIDVFSDTLACLFRLRRLLLLIWLVPCAVLMQLACVLFACTYTGPTLTDFSLGEALVHWYQLVPVKQGPSWPCRCDLYGFC
jgi:hypothetical protein